MRLFIGLPVPDRISEALARHARAIGLANARWTPPENLHLTLLFLGEVGEDKLQRVLRELNELEPPPLQVRLSGLGTFPRAGVLFAEVELAPKLLGLQDEIGTRMARCGFAPEERPYHPHITLARFRQPVRLSGKPLSLPVVLQRSFAVDEVNLYRSQTLQSGPVYEVIAQKRAGAPSAGGMMEGSKTDSLVDPAEQE